MVAPVEVEPPQSVRAAVAATLAQAPAEAEATTPSVQPVRDALRELSPDPVREGSADAMREPGPDPVREGSADAMREPGPDPVREAGLQPTRGRAGERVPGQLVTTASDMVRDVPLAGQDAYRPTCTQAQLRRFIKSRPWIPMHELRRRFGIDGGDDDVSPIRVGEHTLFIGLPPSEGRMIAELLGSDVGYELSLDPCTPVVIGVYPLRPVPRS